MHSPAFMLLKPSKENTIRTLITVKSKLACVAGLASSFFMLNASAAQTTSYAQKKAGITITKTASKNHTATKNIIFSEIEKTKTTNTQYSPFCIEVDLTQHHLQLERQVLLIGQSKGHIFQAEIGMYSNTDIDKKICDGASVVITTDLANIASVQDDLYLGSLNITISTE